MKIDMTATDFAYEILACNNATQVKAVMENLGITFKPELRPLVKGIYRREQGTDLVQYHYDGTWSRVRSRYGENKIVWTLNGSINYWVLVLDRDMEPVVDGLRILMDSNGNRIG